jgi:hypothetical protein
MLSLKDAAAKAVEYMKQLFPDAHDIIVEEVEMDDSKSFWFITLSIPLGESEQNPFLPLPSNWLNTRRFKSFKIDARNGEVISMKIREFQQ